MYRYGIKKIRDIAENYGEYSPEAEHTDNEQMCSLIEFKADFDTAVGKLPVEERKLIFNEELYCQYDRDKLFRKMIRFLNGEKPQVVESYMVKAQGRQISMRHS